MTLAQIIRAWLLVRPFRRIRNWRNKRRARKGLPPIGVNEEDQFMELPTWVKEFVSMVVRHGFGLAGGWLAGVGITVTDSMVQTAVGVVLGGIALLWSAARKRTARDATL